MAATNIFKMTRQKSMEVMCITPCGTILSLNELNINPNYKVLSKGACPCGHKILLRELMHDRSM
jgi:DNA-directed RNA polymerase subunit RPC12/RpoP